MHRMDSFDDVPIDIFGTAPEFLGRQEFVRMPGCWNLLLHVHIRTSALYSAVRSATKSLLYVASRLYSWDRLRDRPRPRLTGASLLVPVVPLAEDAEGKAFRILRCFHAAASMGDAVDPSGTGADPSDPSSSRAPLRCSRRVRLSLAFCLRMCRIPRRPAPEGWLRWLRFADADAFSRRSDDPWKDDHASTLDGRERNAVVAARAKAAVEAGGRRMIPMILKQNNETIQFFLQITIDCQIASWRGGFRFSSILQARRPTRGSCVISCGKLCRTASSYVRAEEHRRNERCESNEQTTLE